MSTVEIRVTEDRVFGTGFRLDKANGIAHGMAVCGFVSQNGRDYPKEVLARDKGVYEGSQVYIDHMERERKVREWFGELRNVRIRSSDGKPVADLHYPKTGAFTAEFEERAEKFPGSFGLSHVAVCKTRRTNGRDVIEAIQRVDSVDLVARPATNRGLFESTRRRVLQEIEDATDTMTPRDGTAIAVLLDRVCKLADDFETGTITIDAFHEQVNKLIKGYRKVVTAMPANESRIPTDGKAFARSLTGAKPGSIPTDGKKFAESLRSPRERGERCQPTARRSPNW